MNWLFQLHYTQLVAHAVGVRALVCINPAREAADYGRHDQSPRVHLANFARSGAPAVAYTTVYSLTMLLRILCAQALTLTLIR